MYCCNGFVVLHIFAPLPCSTGPRTQCPPPRPLGACGQQLVAKVTGLRVPWAPMAPAGKFRPWLPIATSFLSTWDPNTYPYPNPDMPRCCSIVVPQHIASISFGYRPSPHAPSACAHPLFTALLVSYSLQLPSWMLSSITPPKWRPPGAISTPKDPYGFFFMPAQRRPASAPRKVPAGPGLWVPAGRHVDPPTPLPTPAAKPPRKVASVSPRLYTPPQRKLLPCSSPKTPQPVELTPRLNFSL